MKLLDLRRITIRKNLRIRFRLPNGLECLVNEDGVAQVPSLRTVPDFDLEEQLGQVREFLVEPARNEEKGKSRTQSLNLEQLAALTGSSATESAHHEDHDD